MGLEWLKQDGMTDAEQRQWIEPICRLFSIRHLITLTELGNFIRTTGLNVEVLEDVAQHGNILRNWELIDQKDIQSLRTWLAWLIPPTQRLLLDSGTVLCHAAREGKFLLGHWRARNPV